MKTTLFHIALLILISNNIFSQGKLVSGYITDKTTNNPIANVEVYKKNNSLLSRTNKNGYYNFYTKENSITITFIANSYLSSEIKIFVEDSVKVDQKLAPLSLSIEMVNVNEKSEILFSVEPLKNIIETNIYAGKKSEAILISNSNANLASNNARQIYSKIPGLNIYENDDAGIQLNIGGRGLDPNRTANFNTRQNNYDISADVLGYPESYYTPPAECLEKIQILKGAASLQYGTQFGGLINFIIKNPDHNKKATLITRNTIGSNNLYTNFTSISGTFNRLSYYSFINYKKGDGFRDNSNFLSKNFYTILKFQFNSSMEMSAEITYLDYIAKQAGGLTDRMFYEDPSQSNRSRNWFKVDWLLYNLKLKHDLSKKTKYTLNIFGLNAKRFALGFRSNRVDQIDPLNERDLIKGDFKNIGSEFKLIRNYNLFSKNTTSLIGCKLYHSNNLSEQGPGSSSNDADFNFRYISYPSYVNQSKYNYPNLNTALFSETIFYINNSTTITPGLRYEYINTKSDGFYKQIILDGANNPILDTTIYNNQENIRNFLLTGVGITYKAAKYLEYYSNISQNYRSITFADISIINPAYIINPEISDENGYTTDIGVRGRLNNLIYYDLTGFRLLYKNRIGFVQKITDDGNVKSEKGNIGNAEVLGTELLYDMNFNSLLPSYFQLNTFINASFIISKYLSSDLNGITGNELEFIPKKNIKTGLKIGYKNFIANLQYTYISKQYTDATNAISSNLSGVIGMIPEYSILDLATNYKVNNLKIEMGVNNLLNTNYFTRRATGYPGPGIIPSQKRNYYITLQIQI